MCDADDPIMFDSPLSFQQDEPSSGIPLGAPASPAPLQEATSPTSAALDRLDLQAAAVGIELLATQYAGDDYADRRDAMHALASRLRARAASPLSESPTAAHDERLRIGKFDIEREFDAIVGIFARESRLSTETTLRELFDAVLTELRAGRALRSAPDTPERP